MTDPGKQIDAPPMEPHPSSGHRTPSEIARDEPNPTRPAYRAQSDIGSISPHSATPEERHIRAAVRRSAESGEKRSERHSGGQLPPHRGMTHKNS